MRFRMLAVCLVTLSISLICISCNGKGSNEGTLPVPEQSAINGIVEGEDGLFWAVKTDSIYKTPQSSFYSLSERGWENRFDPGDYINDIYAGSEGHIYASGGKGLYLYDGSAWSLWFESPEPLSGISVLADNDIWVVGAEGGIYHYNGLEWSLSTSFDMTLTDIYAIESNNIWAVGNIEITSQDNEKIHFFNGEVLFYNGSEWAVHYGSGTLMFFRMVFALDQENVWVTNLNGPPLFFDGEKWGYAQGLGPELTLSIIESYGPDSIWLAGGSETTDSENETGIVFRYDGTSWVEEFKTDEFVTALFTSSDSEIWVGMKNGVVMHYKDLTLSDSFILE